MRKNQCSTLFDRVTSTTSDQSTHATNDASHRIDTRLFRRIARLTIPFWRRPQSWPAWIGLAVLLSQGVLLSYLVVRAAALLKDTTNALLGQDWAAFEAGLTAYLIVYAVKMLVPQARFIVDAFVEAAWCRWLSRHVIDQYLARRAYYHIGLQGDLDNPDQRIAESVKPFVDQMIQILQWIVGVCARLGGAVTVFVTIDPRFLLIVPALGVLQIATTSLTIPPIVRRQLAVQMAEGDLRRDLVHVRDHAEAIAFYGGEARERGTVMERARAAADRQFRLDRFQALLSLSLHAALAFAWMALPYLVLGERVASGETTYGDLAQATAITLMMRGVIETLSLIVSSFGELAVRVARLAPLQERFDAMAREEARTDIPRITLRRGGGRVEIEALSLETPDGARRLVQALTLSIGPGESLVIVGETGVGKSSLLRAMAGLWTRGTGRISMPPARETLFLPQQPYFTGGDLRAQLLYPHGASMSDAALLDILDAVRLPNLAASLGGLSAVRDWSQILSGGEQQRLAFARALIAEPGVVFLDEATSALDAETEEQLYARLAGSGASYVSVGHRLGIVAHHTHILTLAREGRWTLAPVTTRAAAQVVAS
ncbi:ABC transporter ATP-binding protein/permease [Methylorubrum rhodesianum]|uniref:ABC transporter ATP-binding protein/permease n=1 Tax=Methylorubrum rhodesianum TaxID=29427 RepID=UPI002896BBC5|nr:ATP-binding cassette domain-containing protein [Methylorubrum rhodesianum]